MSKLEDGYTQRDRYNPETEKTLRQFLSVDGPKGATERYRLRHVYTFDFTHAQRAETDRLVVYGASFEEAIAIVERGGK